MGCLLPRFAPIARLRARSATKNNSALPPLGGRVLLSNRSTNFKSNKSILILVAVICFAVGVLSTAGVVTIDKVNWTDLGLFFGFLAFLF